MPVMLLIAPSKYKRGKGGKKLKLIIICELYVLNRIKSDFCRGNLK